MADKTKEPQPLGSRSGKRGYIRVCVVCGKQLLGVGCSAKYCPECRRKREREKACEYERRRRERARHPAPNPAVREIAARADAAGMTYGQYVAAVNQKGGRHEP